MYMYIYMYKYVGVIAHEHYSRAHLYIIYAFRCKYTEDYYSAYEYNNIVRRVRGTLYGVFNEDIFCTHHEPYMYMYVLLLSLNVCVCLFFYIKRLSASRILMYNLYVWRTETSIFVVHGYVCVCVCIRPALIYV